MNVATLKINLTQRILNIDDTKILEKISKMLDMENIVGFDSDGNPIAEQEYVADIKEALNALAEGKLETYSSEEVKKKIIP